MRTEEVESETEEESEDEATSSSPMSRGPQSLDHEVNICSAGILEYIMPESALVWTLYSVLMTV